MRRTDPNPALETYLDHRTIIIGDVNSGKTRYTLAVAQQLIETGHGPDIVLIDMAPQTTRGIGGKMDLQNKETLLLTCPVQAPRLTGRDNRHIQQLAEQNAKAIESLMGQALYSRRSILIINDTSLYLQAGSPERLLSLIESFPTAILNAYIGESFIPVPFTETERHNVQALVRFCDRVIQL